MTTFSVYGDNLKRFLIFLIVISFWGCLYDSDYIAVNISEASYSIGETVTTTTEGLQWVAAETWASGHLDDPDVAAVLKRVREDKKRS